MSVIGKVAKCKKGRTGLILSIQRTPLQCLTGMCKRRPPLYTGICLDDGRVGQQWQSINPEIIGTLDDWVRLRYKEIVNVSGTPI